MHTLLKSSLRNCTIYRGFGRWAPSVVIYGGRNLKFSEYRLAFRWKLPKGQLEKLKRYVWLRGNGQLFIRWCLVAIKSCSLRHLGGGLLAKCTETGQKGWNLTWKLLKMRMVTVVVEKWCRSPESHPFVTVLSTTSLIHVQPSCLSANPKGI